MSFISSIKSKTEHKILINHFLKPMQQNKRKTESQKEKDVHQESISKKQRLSPSHPRKTNIVEKATTAAAKPSDTTTNRYLPEQPPPPAPPASKVPIKIPYPVLNDKRNMKIILSTLETKRTELLKKRDQNLQNLKAINKKQPEKTSINIE